jgi:hypothetical protein
VSSGSTPLSVVFLMPGDPATNAMLGFPKVTAHRDKQRLAANISRPINLRKLSGSEGIVFSKYLPLGFLLRWTAYAGAPLPIFRLSPSPQDFVGGRIANQSAGCPCGPPGRTRSAYENCEEQQAQSRPFPGRKDARQI